VSGASPGEQESVMLSALAIDPMTRPRDAVIVER
jgi:hypothetical protein